MKDVVHSLRLDDVRLGLCLLFVFGDFERRDHDNEFSGLWVVFLQKR